jgi:hypothetical protein
MTTAMEDTRLRGVATGRGMSAMLGTMARNSDWCELA